jgi:hypothetical protein
MVSLSDLGNDSCQTLAVSRKGVLVSVQDCVPPVGSVWSKSVAFGPLAVYPLP